VAEGHGHPLVGLNLGRDDHHPLFLHLPMDDHHFGHKPKFFGIKH